MLILHHWPSFPRAARVLLAINLAVIALVLYDTIGRNAYAVFMQWSVTTMNFILVVLALGLNGAGARLLARLTRRSWDQLQLAEGQQVIAQVKGVALTPRRGERK